MKITVIIPWVLLFLLFGHNDDARAETEGSILSATLAKSQMMQVITPRLEWAMANNNYAVQLFDADWEVVPNDSIALYQQARQVYIFAKGFEMTNDNRYLKATLESADFMLDYMYNETVSEWAASVDRENTLKRYPPKEYDTAFALFAMVHAYNASKDTRYLDAALATWMLGGLPKGVKIGKGLQKSQADSSIGNEKWSINPLMHFFEALLALFEVTQSHAVWQDIQIIANFVDTALVQDGSYIAEYYENVDQPLAIAKGGYVELGHQIEWAYLFYRAVDQGLDSKYRTLANSLLAYALATGWNEPEGSLSGRADYNHQLIEKRPVWWAQAEFMRLNIYLLNQRVQMEKCKLLLSRSYGFIVNSFLAQNTGGWVIRNSKSEIRPIGYHSVAMYDEINKAY